MKVAVVTGAVNRRNGANGSMLDLYASLGRQNHSVDLFVTDRTFIVGAAEALMYSFRFIRPLWWLRRKKYDAIFLIASAPLSLFLKVSKGGPQIYTFQTSDPVATKDYITKVSNCDVLLFESPVQLDKYQSLKNQRWQKLARPELLRPTVDERRLAREASKAAPTSRFLVLVGSIQPRKNQLYMVKIFQALCRLGYSGNLYLIGAVLDREYYDEILRFCETGGLLGRVIFTGHMTEYQFLLRQAECVCTTSVEEGLSTIIREALYLGQLIFAVEIDGNSGSLSKDNSVLVQADVELEKASLELWGVLSDPSAVARLSAGARETYSHFSNAAYDRKLMQLIRQSP